MPTAVEDKSRVTARVPAELRETLEEAARIQGSTLNQFLVQSAYQEAQRILERETVIRVSQRDAQKMFDLLERPPKANKQLRAAVKAYHTLVGGRFTGPPATGFGTHSAKLLGKQPNVCFHPQMAQHRPHRRFVEYLENSIFSPVEQ